MNSPTIFVMDELVMKVMIFAQFSEILWSHALSFYHYYYMKFILQKRNIRFNQRMILEWFEAIQAHRCQTFRCWCLSPGSPFHRCIVYICAPAHVLAAEKGNFPMGSITKSHRDSQQRAFDYTFQRRRPSCPQYLLTVFSWLGKDILSCWYLCSRFGLQSKRIADT